MPLHLTRDSPSETIAFWQALPRFLLMLVVLAAIGLGGLFAMVMGPFIENEFIHSGSATGKAALEKAEIILGPDRDGIWRPLASNARAQWTAPDFHGDAATFVAFDLPLASIPAFERAIGRQWPPAVPQRMPTANDEPEWMNVLLEDAVYFQAGVETIAISRKTGRVLLRRWEW